MYVCMYVCLLQVKQNNSYDCGIYVIEYFKMALQLFVNKPSDEQLFQIMNSCSKNKMKMDTLWCCIRETYMMKYIEYVVIYLRSILLTIYLENIVKRSNSVWSEGFLLVTHV